jgi:hypothetical protein
MGDVRAISLSSHITEVFQEFKPSGKSYILNGKNNSGYDYVIDRYKYSPTNSAILDSYYSYIYGRGLTANYTVNQANQMAIIQKLFSKDNVKKIVKDFSLFHEASFEIILGKTGNEIAEINHLPKNKVVPTEANEYGEIPSYWYSYNWNDLRKYPAIEIAAFKQGTKEKKTIFVIKEYTINDFYFARPSYYSGLNYAELEEQISIYCINHIKNGLSAGYIINVNEGITDDEVKDAFERNVIRKFTGSENANKFILSFNSNKDSATTLEAVQVADAHQQYEFLTEEARKQLLTAHKVVSGAILGIQTATGFSSNADEIETAFNETMLNVIKPLQDTLTDGFEYVLGQNNITLQLYFEPLRPKIIQAPIVKMASEKKKIEDYGSDIDLNVWELVDSIPVDYEKEDELDIELLKLNNRYEFANVSTGVAKTKSKSEQDTDLYITRYRYSGNQNPEREFCKKMMGAKKLYRKEDIEAMSNQNVNPGFGMRPNPNEPYNIFLWKGGGLLSDAFPNGTCKHFWVREMYRKIGTGKNTAATPSTPAQVRKAGEIPPTNNPKVYIAPHDMK